MRTVPPQELLLQASVPVQTSFAAGAGPSWIQSNRMPPSPSSTAGRDRLDTSGVDRRVGDQLSFVVSSAGQLAGQPGQPGQQGQPGQPGHPSKPVLGGQSSSSTQAAHLPFVSVREADRVSFTCNTSQPTKPDTRLVWLRDGQPLPEGELR